MRLSQVRQAGFPRAGEPGDTGLPAWRFLCAAEIANFAQLRRLVGTVRAQRLAVDLGDRITSILPTARLTAVGRATVEFGFDGGSVEELREMLARLDAALAVPFDIDGRRQCFELVLAGTGAPSCECDDLRLAEELDEALVVARSERRIVVRDLSAAAPSFDRLSLSRDLAGAIERGEMFLHYQPKVHVRRQKVTGVEALIRWHHPVRGLILPGDFIPAAEEAGAIVDLTLWTLEQVIADQRRLAASGHDIEIFVNISGQLLADSAFVARACELVAETQGRIGFEITETSVIRDPDTAIAHLKQIAEIGVPIAIDDYGAGLSSLAYLKQLPARELKIDKMFVTQLTSSNRDPLIVRSTIDLAHALEMEVTAEGVETQAALALLSVMGCDMVQGFLISRPVSFDALLGFLEEDQHLARAEPLRGSFNQPASFWKSA
ncbi:MAG TPA: EAL domain-containing protein [Sphingomonas sp.]|nr:EAL domain-containing protein [Sphingomonas sp.]